MFWVIKLLNCKLWLNKDITVSPFILVVSERTNQNHLGLLLKQTILLLFFNNLYIILRKEHLHTPTHILIKNSSKGDTLCGPWSLLHNAIVGYIRRR